MTHNTRAKSFLFKKKWKDNFNTALTVKAFKPNR